MNDPAQLEIILAEDNSADVAWTLNVLKKAQIGNRIHVIREGKQLLEFLFRMREAPDLPPPGTELLLLLSLKMADSQGLEVLRRIKSDERTKTLPVVIMTSSQDERGVMKSYMLGANACIVKPVELSKFVEAISELGLRWLLLGSEQRRKEI